MLRMLGCAALVFGCDAAHGVATSDARSSDARSGAVPDGAPEPADSTTAPPPSDARPTADGGGPRPGDSTVVPPPPSDARPAPDDDATLPDAARLFIDSGVLCPDGDPPRRFFPDGDGDGYGDVVDLSGEVVSGCEPPAGYVANAADCDDQRAETSPAASESCNGLDDDCDGRVDNDPSDDRAFYVDADRDGFGDPLAAPVFACTPPPGYVDNFVDCNDAAPDVGQCVAPARCGVAGRCLDPGQCDESRDCERGMLCNASQSCEPGSLCGGENYNAAQVIPNLLIVLDRSCSMRTRVNGVRKWQAAVDAILALTQQYAGMIRFGLILFPDSTAPSCGQSDVAVPVGDGAEVQIGQMLTAALDAADPFWPDGPCVTNIDTAMEQASREPVFADPTATRFAMLVTDGQQAGCHDAGGDPGTEGIIAALDAQGVHTFVVGFGGEVDAAQLGRFAQAGGVPRPAAPAFYQADDAAGLLAALQSIGSQVVSCDFALADAPPDPFDLHVFFDNQEAVPRDGAHQNGWDYDVATQIVTFYGPACDRITSRQVGDVDVIFGCPTGGG